MNGVINRKDAIGAILSVGHIAELSDGDAVIRVSAVNYVLRNLPSVDVQAVKRGHWIPKLNGEFRGGAYWYDCSECGHTVAGGFLSGNNFCPRCGARMDGE